MLIIGGDGPQKPDGKKSFPEMRKRMDGIGGKYSSKADDAEESAPQMDNDKQKLEASKLLLRAIRTNDPELVAEAISTLVECCYGEDDGAVSEDGEDSGETD